MIKGIAVVIDLSLLAYICHSHLGSVGNIHYSYKARFEAEAHVIADYFSDFAVTGIILN